MKILYGTTNKGKIRTMEEAVERMGVEIIGLKDLECVPSVMNECGESPLENAAMKAKAYYEAFHMPVFSCDSRLYFDELAEVRKSSPGFMFAE